MNKKQPRIKVLIKHPYQDPEIVEIDNTLESCQEIVGGLIQIVPFPTVDGVDLVLNEEGKIFKLDGNFFMPHYQDCVVGPAIMTSSDDEGNLASISEKQIQDCKKYIKTFQLDQGQDLYFDFYHLNNTMQQRQRAFNGEGLEAA